VVVDLLDDEAPAEGLVGEDAPPGTLRGRGRLGQLSLEPGEAERLGDGVRQPAHAVGGEGLTAAVS